MRGLGAFQMAQMKHRDARVFMLCQHLRAAIDVLEQIASEPFQPPPKAKPETVVAAPVRPWRMSATEPLLAIVRGERGRVDRATQWVRPGSRSGLGGASASC